MPIRETTIEAWNLAIEDGLDFRRQYGRESQWAKCESLFYQANEMQQSNTGPNIIAGTGDALLSTLLVPNPRLSLKALRMDVMEAVPVLEAQLNTLISALNVKTEMEMASLHAYLYGRGIIKLGYDSEFGYDPAHDLGQKGSIDSILGISLTQFDKKGSKIEYDSNISPGMPWAKCVLPHDFIVPWGTVSIKSSPWCAHRIVRHIDDIKADPKYDNKRDLVPMLSMSDWVKSYLTVMKPYRMGVTQYSGRRAGSDKAEYVEMWEIHDARTGRVQVVSQGHPKFLRDEIDYLQEDGLPFISLGFVPSSRTFWTTPDVVYLESTQEEAIDIATMQRKHRRISTMRFMYEEGSIEQDELEKFMSSEIGIGVKVKSGMDVSKSIISITPSNPNNQLQSEAEAIRRDARETVGFGRNQTGEYNPGRHSATEASIVQQRSDVRLDRRQQQLAGSYCELGLKFAKIIFKFWRTPRLVEIIGPYGASQWTSFTGSDLKGEYQFKTTFSSDPPDDHQKRVQDAMTWFTQLAMDPTIDQIALRRMLVRAVNDPEFTSIFKMGIIPGAMPNGNLANAMQQLQQNVGGGQQPDQESGGEGPNRGVVPQLSAPAGGPTGPGGPPRAAPVGS